MASPSLASIRSNGKLTHVAPYQITSDVMKGNKSKSSVVGNLMCVKKLQKHSLEVVSQFTVRILHKNE